MKRAILITPDNETFPFPLPDDDPAEELASLQGIVGGPIQMVPHEVPNMTVFCNEEGKLQPLAVVNRLATALFGGSLAWNDPIVGNVVVMGPINTEGDTLGLTVEQVDIFLSGKPNLLDQLVTRRDV